MKFQNTTGGIGVVQNQNDILLPITSIAVPASGLVQRQVTTSHGYSSLGVYMSRTAGPGQPVCATVQNLSSGGQTTFCASMDAVPGTGSGGYNQFQCILPCDNSPGDLLTISVYWMNPVFNSTFGNLIIFGSTSVTGIPQMRSDGRAYPTGQFAATAVLTTATSIAIQTTPPSPIRVLIHTLGVSGSGGGGLNGSLIILITKQTTNQNIMYNSAPNPQFSQQYPQGILCDPGANITFQQSGSTVCTGMAIWDYVV